MDKINGFFKAEVERLIAYMQSGIERGEKLSALFASYGRENGRAKGSVRNFYYKLLKDRNRKETAELLKNTGLKAEPVNEFSETDEKLLLRNILIGVNGGKSVRSIIRQISAGDDKLTLRYQNKYRNLIKKKPQLVTEVKSELSAELGIEFSNNETKTSIDNFVLKRLQNEINGLCDKIGESLRRENRSLKMRLDSLERENYLLKSTIKEFSEKKISLYTQTKDQKLLS